MNAKNEKKYVKIARKTCEKIVHVHEKREKY